MKMTNSYTNKGADFRNQKRMTFIAISILFILGAGNIFMTWHEGRWSFVIRNLNSETGNEEIIDL
jgi:hypothetical protein